MSARPIDEILKNDDIRWPAAMREVEQEGDAEFSRAHAHLMVCSTLDGMRRRILALRLDVERLTCELDRVASCINDAAAWLEASHR